MISELFPMTTPSRFFHRPSPKLAAATLAASLALAACGGTGDVAVDEPTSSDQPTESMSPSEMSSDGEMDDDMHADDMHDHMGTVETSGMSVALDVTADAKAGWNVHLVPTGLTWAPEHASSDPVDGEGHAHVYVDGEKVARVYTEWFHLNTMLTPGEHVVSVSLNANNHSGYAVDGEAVVAEQTIVVPDVGAMTHMHGDPLETDADLGVTLDVVADPKAGWNVHLMPTGFTWTPEHASSDPVDGEGHAHLYVDGEKVGRVYGEWFHLNEDLEPGDHVFRVTLNANDHSDYAIDGELVEAEVTITVEA